MKLETDEIEVSVVEHPGGRLAICVLVAPQKKLTIASFKEGEPIKVGSKNLSEDNCGIPTDERGRPQVEDYNGTRLIPKDRM